MHKRLIIGTVLLSAFLVMAVRLGQLFPEGCATDGEEEKIAQAAGNLDFEQFEKLCGI